MNLKELKPYPVFCTDEYFIILHILEHNKNDIFNLCLLTVNIELKITKKRDY